MSKLGTSSLFKTILLTATLAVSFTASAFAEGTDYMVPGEPVPNTDKALIKVFDYTCPFCYKYNKVITGPVSEKMRGIVAFTPFHPGTKGEYGRRASEVFVVLINKDRAAGISLSSTNSQFKKAKFVCYAAYHDEKERQSDGKDPAAFAKAGLDTASMSQADFEATLKEPVVQGALKKWKAPYDVAKIQGVLAHVVNGRYLIYTKSIKSVDAVANLIRELASK